MFFWKFSSFFQNITKTTTLWKKLNLHKMVFSWELFANIYFFMNSRKFNFEFFYFCQKSLLPRFVYEQIGNKTALFAPKIIFGAKRNLDWSWGNQVDFHNDNYLVHISNTWSLNLEVYQNFVYEGSNFQVLVWKMKTLKMNIKIIHIPHRENLV